MADTFDKLADRMPRHEIEPPKLGSIRVRFIEGRPAFKLVLDGSRVGPTHRFLQEQIIKVEPGLREVAVVRGRQRLVSRTLLVEAGGRVDLVLRMNPGWAEFDRQQARIFGCLGFIYPPSMGLGWLVAPLVRGPASRMIALLALPGPVQSVLQSMTRDRFGMGMLFFLACFVPFLASCLIWWRRQSVRLEAEVGPRYSLEIAGTGSAEGPAHLDKMADPIDWDFE
jgi:hypothetical protein